MRGAQGAPPGKHPSGTFMSSNHLVSNQTHKNGQYYDLKWSKFLFNCIKDSRMTQKIHIFKNFKIFYLKNVSRHSGGPYNIQIRHFGHFSVGGVPGAPLMSSRVKIFF